jgi:hypothetical protein
MRPVGDLYSTAAQVIPLLVGLLAFELRAFTLRESAGGGSTKPQRFTVLTTLCLILLLGLGEVAAIHVLAKGTETIGARTAVLTALFAGGLLLVLGILEAAVKPLFTERARLIAVVSNATVVLAVAGWLLLA